MKIAMQAALSICFATGCLADEPTQQGSSNGDGDSTGEATGTSADELTKDGATTAAHDDSFTVYTSNNCGSARFVDYGPGTPGNGVNNDDYIEFTDICNDHRGVLVYAAVNGVWNSDYNGAGHGHTIIWDPLGNVKPGDLIELEVCLVDESGNISKCEYKAETSVDG
jgi:hypothetical protein